MIIKNFTFKRCKFTLVYQGCSFVVLDADDGVICVMFGQIDANDHLLGFGCRCGLRYMPYTIEELAVKVIMLLTSIGVVGLDCSFTWKYTDHLFIPHFELSEIQREICGLL